MFMKFVIHIKGIKNKSSLKVFDVPESQLKSSLFSDQIEAAGWWYKNMIDSFSTTGPYEWTVIPL